MMNKFQVHIRIWRFVRKFFPEKYRAKEEDIQAEYENEMKQKNLPYVLNFKTNVSFLSGNCFFC